MSKKVLKLAGRRPMVLALFVMATLTVSLLFSGWLTPTPSRAQGTGGPNPPPSNENTNCASTNCIEGGIILGVLPIIPKTNCVFNGVSASANPIVSNGWYVVKTGCTNVLTNYIPVYPIIISDSNRWEASGVGVTIPNGIGLVAGFTPTNCGEGTVTFYSAWQDACGTNLHDISVSTNFYARCPTMTIGTVTVVPAAVLQEGILHIAMTVD